MQKRETPADDAVASPGNFSLSIEERLRVYARACPATSVAGVGDGR